MVLKSSSEPSDTTSLFPLWYGGLKDKIWCSNHGWHIIEVYQRCGVFLSSVRVSAKHRRHHLQTIREDLLHISTWKYGAVWGHAAHKAHLFFRLACDINLDQSLAVLLFCCMNILRRSAYPPTRSHLAPCSMPMATRYSQLMFLMQMWLGCPWSWSLTIFPSRSS